MKVELRKRNCLPTNTSVNCVLCNEREETVEHVLFECRASAEAWAACVKWLGTVAVFPVSPKLHFISFINLFDAKVKRQICSCIWVGLVWLIWNSRNAIVFNEGTWDVGRILNDLKVRTWFWLSCNRSSLLCSCNFHQWMANPWGIG